MSGAGLFRPVTASPALASSAPGWTAVDAHLVKRCSCGTPRFLANDPARQPGQDRTAEEKQAFGQVHDNEFDGDWRTPHPTPHIGGADAAQSERCLSVVPGGRLSAPHEDGPRLHLTALDKVASTHAWRPNPGVPALEVGVGWTGGLAIQGRRPRWGASTPAAWHQCFGTPLATRSLADSCSLLLDRGVHYQ